MADDNKGLVVASPEEVLDAWFHGDYTDKPFSRLWFAASNSANQRDADEFIRARFLGTLKAVENDIDNIAIDASKETTVVKRWKTQPMSFVALIVVVDQFSRHIYRDRTNGQVERLKTNDNFAMVLAKEFLVELKWDRYVPTLYQIFATMPLRHNNPSIGDLEFVLSQIDKYKERSSLNEKVLAKFEKQTVRRLEALRDAEKVSGCALFLCLIAMLTVIATAQGHQGYVYTGTRVSEKRRNKHTQREAGKACWNIFNKVHSQECAGRIGGEDPRYFFVWWGGLDGSM